MAKKSNTGQALKTFVMGLGVPEGLAFNSSKERNSLGTEFIKLCRKNYISISQETKPEPIRRGSRGSLKAMVSYHDEKESHKKSLGLWIPTDNAGHAKNVNTISWITRILPIKWCNRWETLNIWVPGFWIIWPCILQRKFRTRNDGHQKVDWSIYRVGGIMLYWILNRKGMVISKTTVQHISSL